MKLQKLFLFVLSIIVFGNTYGQGLNSSVSVAGTNLSSSNNAYYSQSNNFNCDTISSFKTRHTPSGLTWDGQYFWYVNDTYIYKVNTAGVHLDSITNPSSAYTNSSFLGGDITFDGINLWFVCEQAARLFKINATTKTGMQSFPLPSFGKPEPDGWGLAWDGTNLWHSQYNPPRLYKLNPSDASVIDSLIMPSVGLLGIKWKDNNLYGTTNDSKMFKINTSTGAIMDTTNWCIPYSLGFTWDGSSFWGVSGPAYINSYYTGGKEKIYKLSFSSVVAIGEQVDKTNNLEIYPNPATSSIFVKGKDIKWVEIYNALGEKIYVNSHIGYQDEPKEIILSNIPNGVYLVRIQDGTTITTQKIVKQ